MDYGRKLIRRFWPLKRYERTPEPNQSSIEEAVVSGEQSEEAAGLVSTPEEVPAKSAQISQQDESVQEEAPAAPTAKSEEDQSTVQPQHEKVDEQSQEPSLVAEDAPLTPVASGQDYIVAAKGDLSDASSECIPDEDTCAICWAQMGARDPQGLPVTSLVPYCRHRFHTRCIAAWMKFKWICPMCRRFALLLFEFPPLPASLRNRLFR